MSRNTILPTTECFFSRILLPSNKPQITYHGAPWPLSSQGMYHVCTITNYLQIETRMKYEEKSTIKFNKLFSYRIQIP